MAAGATYELVKFPKGRKVMVGAYPDSELANKWWIVVENTRIGCFDRDVAQGILEKNIAEGLVLKGAK